MRPLALGRRSRPPLLARAPADLARPAPPDAPPCATAGDLLPARIPFYQGKGSTCVLAESILRSSGRRTALFTSPHLVDVRERIRINGRLISKAEWTKRFWEVWDKLWAAAQSAGADAGGPPLMPAYFRFLTLLALYVFVKSSEPFDAVLLEVGLGGRLDATNVVKRPVVCGITHLGLDHVELLGDTVGKIAYEKAGIMKPGVDVVTAEGQEAEADEVLRARSADVGAPLSVARPLHSYAGCAPRSIELGLAGAHQHENAAVAVALCRKLAAHERSHGPASSEARAAAEEAALARGELPHAWRTGLESATWPGRAQIVPDSGYGGPEDGDDDAAESDDSDGSGDAIDEHPPPTKSAAPNLTFYMDGAHTPESMVLCAEWFAKAQSRQAAPGPRDEVALLFNIMDERSPEELLAPLSATLEANGVRVSRALFTPPNSSYKSVSSASPAVADNLERSLVWQERLRSTWDGLPRRQPNQGSSAVVPSLRDTLAALRARAAEVRPAKVRVLVTGSLYIIGDLLKMLRRPPR